MIGGLSGTERLKKKNPAHDDMIWDMGWRGHEIIRNRVERYDIDCDLKHGYVDVALKEQHLRDFEAANEELAKRNYPFEHRMMSRNETCDALGTEHYIGALLNMGNGHLHPLNLCIGESKAAESLGAVLYEQSAALKIDHGDAVRISTAE